jgi:hypothetical protein
LNKKAFDGLRNTLLEIEMAVYEPTLKLLSDLPKNRTINLAVRHSERYPILKPEDVSTAPLTPEGFRVAEEFGQRLARLYTPGKLETSQTGRCIDTGAAIARGAEWDVEVLAEPRLTYTYVDDAWKRRRTHIYLDAPLPAEVLDLVRYLCEPAAFNCHLNVFVTHDSVLGCMAGYLFKDLIDQENWPHYLEGMAFWQEDGKVFSAWRGQVAEITALI